MTNEELERAIGRLKAAGEDGTVLLQSADDEAVQEIRQVRDGQHYPDKARILYTGGAGRRIVEPYEWNQENGYQEDVEGADLIRTLLLDGDFVIVEKQTKKASK